MPELLQKMAFLEWLFLQDTARQEGYRHYREYYDGDHDTRLTDRLREFLQIKDNEEFNCNLCPIIVDALAEKLIVTGFDAGDQGETFWQWWTANRMDAAQHIVHTAAVRDGDTYVLVEWDSAAGRPVFNHEMAFDGSVGMKVHYGEKRGVVEFASKRWRVEQGPQAGDVRRLNLYYPDRIEKYISKAGEFEGAWQPYREEGQEWPIVWQDGKGQPLGVPVVHWKNRDVGYNYGTSEIKDVVPIQNALNKTLIDLLLTADNYGFPQPWMTGDMPTGIKVGPGIWLYSEKETTRIGKMEAEDPSKLIALLDALTSKAAQITRTPLSYFQMFGQMPAADTQKMAEGGLISKCKDRQTVFGNAWEDAMKMARRLANTFGGVSLNEDASINTMWADAETRNEVEHLTALGIKADKLGIPRETLWEEAGYTPEQIEKMKQSDEYKARLNLMRMAAIGAQGVQEGQGQQQEEGQQEGGTNG